MKQLEKPSQFVHNSKSEVQLEGSSPVPATSVPLKSSFLKRALWRLCWGVGGGITALTLASLGFFTALLIPLPESSSSQDAPAAAHSSKQIAALLGKGLIPYKITRPLHILVMGIDRIEDAVPGSPESFGGRSDTLLLIRVDPIQESLAVLSIPRDTQIKIPGYGLTKVNHANWFGGPLLTRQVIRHNFNDLPIDRYIRVNTGAFQEIVDLVGGLKVFVPEDMYYVDQTQNLTIDLKAGWQILDGDKAEQFARFRNNVYGDIGRIQRQQILLKALRQKLTNPKMLAKVPQFLEVFQDYVDTNLSFEEMVALAGFGLQVETDHVQMVMLPGRPSEVGEFSASYWIADGQARDRLLHEYFDQPTLFARSDFVNVTDASAHHQPRIAVQNASGEPKQGRKVANYLRDLGFWHVYVVPDWPDQLTATQIIVQRGDLQAAQSLQSTLDLGQIEASSIGDLESDLTLRIGQDSLQLLATDRLETDPSYQNWVTEY